jgi:hypothetical protein
MKKTLIGPENPSTGLRQVVLTRLLVVPALFGFHFLHDLLVYR